jgi:hypothetical protein
MARGSKAKPGGGFSEQGKKKKGNAPSGTIDRDKIPLWMRDAMTVQADVQKERGANKSEANEKDGWETKGGYGGKTWGEMNAKERRKAERAKKFKEENAAREASGTTVAEVNACPLLSWRSLPRN